MRLRFIFLALSLTACSPSILYTPHKMDVQQGNVVTESMLGKVKPGMTKSQVRFALGTPLISDPFHTERWDYVYRYRTDGELTGHSRLTVVFEDDKLKTVEGTVLPPGNDVAYTKLLSPIAVSTLMLAPEQPRPPKPPELLDFQHLESVLGAAPSAPPPAAEAAKPAMGQSQAEQPKQAQAEQPEQAQAEQPKKSFGERLQRLFGFGKKDEETQQAKVEEKPKVQPETLTEPQPAAQAQKSFGERFMRLFGFGKKDEETQQVKFEEKPEAQPDLQQEEAEPPTHTVVTADRAPPPKRSAGERFMRLIGFKEKAGDDPAPPVTTEVNTTIPRISSLSPIKVWKQILGLDDDNDKEKKAAAEDIEPGETVKSSGAQGSAWQRFKRLIGAGGDEVEVSTTPVSKDQQATQAGNEAKPEAAKPEAAKP